MASNKRKWTFRTLKSVILFAVQFFAFTSGASLASNGAREAMFYTMQSASLIGNVTLVKQTRSELDCAFSCFRTHPGKCFSFNFGRIAFNELHTCELSNSERAIEPHKMKSRKGFDYFGMESVYLARFYPCLSFPCRNGGSCVNGPSLKMFSCSCPLNITVLPYIDAKCNFNQSLIQRANPIKNVFHARVGRYQLNYFEALRLCEILGGTLASLEQLTTAWQSGLELCRRGWLINATTAYPMRQRDEDCGNKTGIIGGDVVHYKTKKKSNAWCYVP